MTYKKINAPFRWAGSKAKLTDELFEVFENKNVYAEAFLGSGVVLFRLLQEKKYNKYYVNDINISIISFYKDVKKDSKSVLNKLYETTSIYNNLKNEEEKKEMYYSSREQFNKDKSNYTLFWFLMKTGFNGLYRENKKGEYNSPFGYKEKISYNEFEILEIARLLNENEVEFYNLDYREFYSIVENQTKELFAYNDPPYCQSQDYTAEKFDNTLLAKNLLNKDYPVAISDVDSEVANSIYKDYLRKQSRKSKELYK